MRTLLAGSFALLSAWQMIAQSHPLVIGYERFHSDSPSAEGGRLLFNELGCVNCHDNPTGLPPRMGPRLAGITDRVKPDWIQSYLSGPTDDTAAHSHIPHANLTNREIEAITHYLASLQPEKPVPKAFKFVNADRGVLLYHTIGCVACHGPDPEFAPEEGFSQTATHPYPHIPLSNLSDKNDIHSLSAYLFKPHDFNPHGRMPQFSLEREDGGDIAAYLLRYANGDSTDYPRIPALEPDRSLVREGKAIVAARNCLACHELPETEGLSQSRPALKPANAPIPDQHPGYHLSNHQQRSIRLFLEQGDPVASATLSLESLNCLACHERDGIGGPDTFLQAYFAGNHDLGDTGRLPPPLTGIGRKLQPDWLAAAVAGKKSVRPYLKTQMPNFGPSVTGLADRLLSDDETGTTHTVRKQYVEAGRKLLGIHGGLNCITCHGWNDRPSLGITALNLGNLHERIQLGWLHDYLIDPAAYRPNTLMPSFWPGGIASNRDVLDGDTAAQINAIYAFSKFGDGLPEGFPSEFTSEYELKPVDRPIVQRSFLDGVGTHALLVGFPEGVHVAFDGASGRPAIMWKGRFFDAYRTWFSRFPEFETPLGESIVRWSTEERTVSSRYRGYRFRSDGIPEFLAELNGSVLYERLQPIRMESGNLRMQRIVRYTNESQLSDNQLQHPANVSTTEVEDHDPMTRTFIYQW